MAIDGHWLSFGDGYSGYAAHPPSSAPLPAVVVIQEAWGVDAHIEDVTRRLAQAGYFAFAPALFMRNGAAPAPLSLSRMAQVKAFAEAAPAGTLMNPQGRAKALEGNAAAAEIEESVGAMMGQVMNLAQHVPQLLAATDFLRAQPTTKGQKIASVGFCMGGGCSALLACSDPKLSAAAIFYGSAPPADKVPEIRCPVLGFYGASDTRINEGIPAFSRAMQEHGKSYEATVLPGAGHAFFNDTRSSYHAPAARESWARLLDFFRRTL